MNPLDKRQIRRAFDRAAASYDQAAVVQRQMADELMTRLAGIKEAPKTVLDVGCGTGYARPALAKRFPDADYLGSDVAPNMLRQARPWGWRLRRQGRWFCGDAERLPLADDSVDLVFCNAVLQWCDPQVVFAELHRVLDSEGLLVFSTFGPDTLHELREAWAQVDAAVHVHEFMDMHHLGDMMLYAGFALPVVDVDYLTVTHRSVAACLRDLKTIGAGNAAGERARGLTPRRKLRALENAYATRRNADGLIETTYEIVYGHARASVMRRRRPADRGTAAPAGGGVDP